MLVFGFLINLKIKEGEGVLVSLGIRGELRRRLEILLGLCYGCQITLMKVFGTLDKLC